MTTQTEEKLFRISDNQPLTFQSIGIVRGKLLNLDSGNRGDLLLLTEQGIFPLQIQRELGRFLVKNHTSKGVDLAEEDRTWLVYPKQFRIKLPDGTKQTPLGFTLAGLIPEGDYNPERINKFSIRGAVSKQVFDQSLIQVSLKRNIKVKKHIAKQAENQPFKVKIDGKLTEKGVGWFWEFECGLEEGKLILIAGKKLEQVPLPGAPKKPFNKKPTRNKKVLPVVKGSPVPKGAPVVKKKIETPVAPAEKPKKKFSFESR